MSKEELILKLQKISELCDDVLDIKQQMDDFVPEDTYPRVCEVPFFPGDYADEETRELWEEAIDHSDEDAVEQMAKKYNRHYEPKKPTEPKIGEFQRPDEKNFNQKMSKLKSISIVAAVVGILFFLSILMNVDFSNFFESLSSLSVSLFIVAAAAFTFLFCRKQMAGEKATFEKNEKEAKALYEENKATLLAEYQEKMSAYTTAYNAFEEARQSFLDAYVVWREAFLESCDEEEKIEQLLENDRLAAVDKIRSEAFIPAVEKLEAENDILSKDYLGAIDLLIDLLKGGRADTLKEAINVYEEMVYRERQLQLQREAEAQRRHEEAMQREAEERRYQEQMAFQREQERQRQYEADRQQRMAEQHHQEQMKLQKQQELDRQRAERIARETQERKAWQAEQNRKQEESRAISRQCNTCARCGKCSLSFTRANCASYIPR